MPKIQYITKKFNRGSQDLIAKANKVIEEYQADGFDLTLRQLYYQFVARGFIKNDLHEYKRLGNVINDGRLAGLIDWDSITDRTRNLMGLAHWGKPEDLVRQGSNRFRLDKWANQKYRPEVWIEKEALAGVFERVCVELDVPFFSCRGYTSQSEMWGASQRLLHWAEQDQIPFILHFGDHDPSGQDMTRDIVDRLEMFMKDKMKLHRLALNMDQIREHKPPPNPAKTTDSRYAGYIKKYGQNSWELDALDPKILAGLVRKGIKGVRDFQTWKRDEKQERRGRREIEKVARHWSRVQKRIKELK